MEAKKTCLRDEMREFNRELITISMEAAAKSANRDTNPVDLIPMVWRLLEKANKLSEDICERLDQLDGKVTYISQQVAENSKKAKITKE